MLSPSNSEFSIDSPSTKTFSKTNFGTRNSTARRISVYRPYSKKAGSFLCFLFSMVYSGLAASPLTLGEDEYFVLGDNRTVSADSYRLFGSYGVLVLTDSATVAALCSIIL